MKLQYREVHRDEIRKQTLQYVRHEWESYFAALGGVVFIAVLVISELLDPTPKGQSAFILFCLLFGFCGLVMIVVFRNIYRQQPRELKPSLSTQITFSFFAVVCVRVDLLYGLNGLAFIVGGVVLTCYTYYKLFKTPQSVWYLFFFRCARQYFKAVKSAVDSKH